MKRMLACVLTLSVLFLLLSPCGIWGDARAEENQYRFKPHVMTEEIKQFYGEDFVNLFFGFCDALLNGDESYPCPDSDTEFAIWETARSCFPLASEIAYTDYPDDFSSGTAKLLYHFDWNECHKRIEDFESRVESILNTFIPYSCSDTEKALRLYAYFAQECTYDGELLNDLGRYLREGGARRTIMSGQGCCQEIAPAYAYLLLQAGVDAGICIGSQQNGNSHEWNIINLNGKYYYVDPTYAMNRPQTLRYFGMTLEERVEQGSFLPDTFYLFVIGEISANEFHCIDERFKPLWFSFNYEFDDHILKYNDNLGQEYLMNLE